MEPQGDPTFVASLANNVDYQDVIDCFMHEDYGCIALMLFLG